MFRRRDCIIDAMNRLIVGVAILTVCNLLIVNAEKIIVVIPNKQLRRSPVSPTRSNVRSPSYTKYSPYNSYGPMPPGATDFQHGHDAVSHATTPYVKAVNYPIYGREHVPYEKMKPALVPSIKQSRYSPEATRLRQPTIPVYGPIPAASGYYHRVVTADPYNTIQYSPPRSQPVERPQIVYAAHRQPIGNPEPSASQSSPPSAVSSGSYPKVGPIIVKATGNRHEPVHSKDLLKESSSVVSKIPPAPSLGAGKNEIVIRDSLNLDEYEKTIAEFTKSWPKLSALPGAFGSASSYFPVTGSSLSQSLSGIGRSSAFLDTSNSIGRQGYAVKEEIDEPPIDFRTMPIITSPLQYYPTPTPASVFQNIYG